LDSSTDQSDHQTSTDILSLVSEDELMDMLVAAQSSGDDELVALGQQGMTLLQEELTLAPFWCPVLLGLALSYALAALNALVNIPEYIQNIMDAYQAGTIDALECLVSIIGTVGYDIVSYLFGNAGFKFFYNLWHDLCTGPSSSASASASTSISDVQASTTQSTVSTLTTPASGCSCGH
jgi:hypothetical protein